MPQELQALQDRLRALLRANMGEARRTQELLRETERKVEEQFGYLDFIETSWYIAGKKFRKEPVEASLQDQGVYLSAGHPPARATLNVRRDASRSANRRVLEKSSPAQNIAPGL